MYMEIPASLVTDLEGKFGEVPTSEDAVMVLDIDSLPNPCLMLEANISRRPLT
jgi:hypothetical protein